MGPGLLRRVGWLVPAVAGVALAIVVTLLGQAPSRAATVPLSIAIQGNHFVNGSGQPIRLLGVNHPSSEYACVDGFGYNDGHQDAADAAAVASWDATAVRVPLNEDCWLGINGVKPGLGGAAYRRAVVRYVDLLHRHGIYVEVSLIWAAPGANRATYQPGGPDEDHAPAVWAGMARAFRNDRRVILAPWGETIVDARCFLDGGVCEATYGPRNAPYRVAGMQQAVGVMRAAGYRGPIAIPGLDYANDLTHWLADEPRDRLHQLVAEAHVYGGNTCSSTACLERTMAPVARRVPLIFGEVGETYDASSCGHANMARLLPWADAHHVGYAAWTWDTWGSCEALISSYDGTPAHDYGAWVRSYYAGTASSEAQR
jgi:hypothetical protein